MTQMGGFLRPEHQNLVSSLDLRNGAAIDDPLGPILPSEYATQKSATSLT